MTISSVFFFQKPAISVDEEIEEEKAPSPVKKPKPGAQAKASEGADVKEIVFSFDTTGSMYPCLTQVKSEWEILKTNSFLDHFISDQKAKNIYHGIKTVENLLGSISDTSHA